MKITRIGLKHEWVHLKKDLHSRIMATYESTPLNKLAVADAAWARMPVDRLNMTLA